MEIGNGRQDQNSPMQQGAAGVMGVSGPQAGTGNATKPAVKKTKGGSGFTGLQSYLTSNPNAGAQANQALTGQQTAFGQKLEQGKQQVAGAIQEQKATGMGQQYQNVDMAGVSNLKAEEDKLKANAKALQTGDYSGFAAAQGNKPMSAGEAGLFGGIMGAQAGQFTPQAQQIAGQDAVGAALKGLAEQEAGQRTAFNNTVAEYQRMYNEEMTRKAQQQAARTSTVRDRMKAMQGPSDVNALNQQILDNANTKLAAAEALRRSKSQQTRAGMLVNTPKDVEERYQQALREQQAAQAKAPKKEVSKPQKKASDKAQSNIFKGGR